MATLYAQSTGNWSEITWNTEANGSGTNQTPVAADTLNSNSYTVTVDGSYTVTQITNGMSGGTFILTDGITLTCTSVSNGITGGINGTVTINGGANVVINADVTGVGNTVHAIAVTQPCTITLNGDVKTGSGALSYGVLVSAAATITVTGDLFSGGGTAPAILLTGAATLAFNGDAVSAGISITGAAIVIANGTLKAASAVAAITNTNASTVITVIGECIPSASAPAISSAVGVVQVTGPLRANANGRQAIYSPLWFWYDTPTGTLEYEVYTNSTPIAKRSLYSADALPGVPVAADVKAGVTYGPSDELIGTYEAVVTPDIDDIAGAVWAKLVADLDTADSIGARLAQSATVDSTGAQIAALGV